MPQKITELQNQLEKIIKGKKNITDKILMAVLAEGHVLLEDVPGVGKTKLIFVIPEKRAYKN